MPDHERGARSRRDGPRGLEAALRREARAGRPAFSAAFHGRVLAALRAASGDRNGRIAGGRRSAWSPVSLGVLAATAACAAFAIGVAWPRPVSRPAVADPAVTAAVGDAVPGIERLPTPGEIGAGVLAEVTTIAAAAVGVPELVEFAAFDPADDAGR